MLWIELLLVIRARSVGSIIGVKIFIGGVGCYRCFVRFLCESIAFVNKGVGSDRLLTTLKLLSF